MFLILVIFILLASISLIINGLAHGEKQSVRVGLYALLFTIANVLLFVQ